MPITSSLDLYGILGLSHKATPEEIEEAYKQLAARLDPKQNKHDGARLQYDELVEVYSILSDKRKHDKYKRERAAYGRLPSFSTICTTSKRVLPIIEEPQVLYLLLEVHAKRLEDEKIQRRPPLNIAIILDRSGSMSGERLARVKVAAHRIIDQLRPDDRLSIVTFSDDADVIIPSTHINDVPALKAAVTLMAAGGATEIFKGLEAGYRQVETHFSQDSVNHIILLTDGRTYGDEEQCLNLADEAAQLGVGISAMGMGDEWNDRFLDDLAGRTGGSSAYIHTPAAVPDFLNARIRNLGEAFAERMVATIAPENDLKIESAFRLSPDPQPLSVDKQPLQLGVLKPRAPITVILQLQMPAGMIEGFRTVARLDVSGDVLSHNQRVQVKGVNDVSVEVSADPPAEVPPNNIVDALGKLTVHRMQERVQEAVDQDDIVEATRRLEKLATRLLDIGQPDLANRAAQQANIVRSTKKLDAETQMTLKFGTRALLPPEGMDDEGGNA